MNLSKYTLVITALFLNACTSTKTITFVQDDHSYPISKTGSDSITIDRKPFSVRYFGKVYDEDNKKFYAAQIAVMDHAPDADKLKEGTQLKNIPFFEPGSGMAAGPGGYDGIIIKDEAHHYLFYTNEESKRVQLISKKGKELELEWKINMITYKGEDYKLSEFKPGYLYFVILMDRNLNEIVDKDELTTVKVKLK